MEGRRLILNPGADEVILENSEAGCADGVLWLYIRDVPLVQAFGLVSDPAKTQSIRFQYGDMEDRFEGFTRPVGIIDNGDMIRAALRREDTNV